VVVRDREPMWSLVIPGTPFLRDSLSGESADLAAFQEAGTSPFAIKDWAYRTFDPMVVNQILVEQLSSVLHEHVGVRLDAAAAYDAHHAA
jgi:hypothetical protein